MSWEKKGDHAANWGCARQFFLLGCEGLMCISAQRVFSLIILYLLKYTLKIDLCNTQRLTQS